MKKLILIVIIISIAFNICHAKQVVKEFATDKEYNVKREYIPEEAEYVVMIGTFTDNDTIFDETITVSTETYIIDGVECFKVKMGTDVVYGRYPTKEEKDKKVRDNTINDLVSAEIISRQERKLDWNISHGRAYAPSSITKEEIEVIRVEIEKEIP